MEHNRSNVTSVGAHGSTAGTTARLAIFSRGAAAAVLALALGGCVGLGPRDNGALGAAMGGVGGAVIGNAVGGTTGAVIGAGVGAAAGASVGMNAGMNAGIDARRPRVVQRVERTRVVEVHEHDRRGRRERWRDYR